MPDTDRLFGARPCRPDALAAVLSLPQNMSV
eukprot:COSAG01_NODE_4132_length_5322_cov_3.930308_1_plen_30_part_10